MRERHYLADQWLPVANTDAGILTAELAAELSEEHILKRLRWIVVARHYKTDDVVIELEDGRAARVHLTWNLHPEPDPYFPVTILFSSLAAFASGAS